jgi:hypothetical protein
MGSYNREIIEEHFTWSRVGDRLEALYAEAMRRAAARVA